MTTKNFNRRSVLKGAAAVAGAAALPMPALAQGTRPDLTIAVQGLVKNLDPIDAISNIGPRVTNTIFDTPLYRDFLSSPDGSGNTIVEGLAESFEQVDPQTSRITLREGVTFHNGEPLRAQDVAFTFGEDRMFGAEPMTPKAKVFKPNLTEVKVIDDRTVEFVTAEPDYTMRKRLASWMAFVVPEADYRDKGFEGFGQAPVGTGPYKLKEFISGDRIVLEANDDYYRGKPTARTVTFQVVPETATRVAGLISGDYDIAVALNPDNIPLLDRYDEIEGRGNVIENTHLVVHRQVGPLENKLVRQAMHLCIDRAALNQGLWGGLAGEMRGFQMPHQGEAYNPDYPAYAQDMAKAKQLLSEAGYNGEKITFRTLPDWYVNGLAAAQVMQQWWQEAGLNVEIEIKENWGQINNEELMSRNWSNGFWLTDPVAPLTSDWHDKGGAKTRYLWDAPEEFGALLDTIRTSPDGPDRTAAFQRAISIWDDEAPATPLYRPYELYGVKKSIGWQPVTFEWMDLRPQNLSFG